MRLLFGPPRPPSTLVLAFHTSAFKSAVRWPFACALLAMLGLGACRGTSREAPEASFTGQLSGSPFDADIVALSSSDFVLRSQAAERLVAAGLASLDALGAAGDRSTPAPGSLSESTTAPVIVAILGRASDAEVQALISSPHAPLRAAASRESGRRGAWTPVPALIERLADSEPAVREAAHAALRRITGEVAEPSGPSLAGARLAGADRAERWRQWWRQEGRARAQAATEPPGS